MALEITVQSQSTFGTGRDLQLQIEGGQHGEKRFQPGGRIAILNQGDGLLAQPDLVAQGLLAQPLPFPGTTDQIANLPWITREVAHGPEYVPNPIGGQYRLWHIERLYRFDRMDVLRGCVDSIGRNLTGGQFERAGRTRLEARPWSVIPLKSKAWLDLTRRKSVGESVDSKNITKHRNDVFRLAATLPGEPGRKLPPTITADLVSFLAAFPVGSEEWHAILASLKEGIGVMRAETLRNAVQIYFRLPIE